MKKGVIGRIDELLPLSRPSVGRDELREVKKVFDTGWLGMGKWVFKFEEKLKEFLSARYVIATSTGTTALHLALDSLGIKKGDEVIVPSLTFVASVQAIMSCGATPVFCDVYPETLTMDVDDMRERITKKTKAVMPVHFGGLPCAMNEVLSIARERGIRVVEDAAHAFGSTYKGKTIGSFGDVACFSFDPIKNITCGEGGAIAASDAKLVNLIYKKRILGISKDTWSRYAHKRDWFYEVTTLGYRYHMSNINAAIGLVQLDKFGQFISRKREIVKDYDSAFKKVSGIELLHRDYQNTAPFNYVIKVKKYRDRLIGFLKTRSIDAGVHYLPNHQQPFFRKFRIALPVTERLAKEIITLPLYYEMSKRDVTKVINAVSVYFK